MMVQNLHRAIWTTWKGLLGAKNIHVGSALLVIQGGWAHLRWFACRLCFTVSGKWESGYGEGQDAL